jgi:hypothetical protein
MPRRPIQTAEDAEALLVEVGAPERLIKHGRLVLEAADELLARAKRLGARGIEAAVARCCVSHARWATMTCSLEELFVALADALWKGVLRESLEKRVVDEIAGRLGVDPWSIFVDLDSCFEDVAERGPERLRRSVTRPE